MIVLKSPRITEVWRENIGTILRHELMHIYLGRIAPGGIPRWFNEGLAISFSGEWDLWDNMDLAAAVVSGNLIPLDEMKVSYPAGEKRAHLFYVESYSTIAFLTSKLGRDGLMALLHRLLTSGSFETALREEAHMTSREFEAEWRTWLSGNYHPLTLFLRRETLFSLGIVILLIAYLVRRRRYRRKILEMERSEEARRSDDDHPHLTSV